MTQKRRAYVSGRENIVFHMGKTAHLSGLRGDPPPLAHRTPPDGLESVARSQNGEDYKQL